MRIPRPFIEILPRLVRYGLSRQGLGNALAPKALKKPPAPINLTFSVTNRCNSRCKSCSIWKSYPTRPRPMGEELRLDEIERIFSSVGSVYFFNISGGEPFLRSDIVDIVRLACKHLQPAVVHIPTNALAPELIAGQTEKILLGMREWGPPGVKLTLKPSYDGVRDLHDQIRGVPGNYDKLLQTLELLRELRRAHDHLRVGVGTVISTLNIDHLPEIIDGAQRFGVDTVISEVAEERVEMDNFGFGITPDHERYGEAIRPFRQATRRRLGTAAGLELVTQGMRYYYYELTRRWLEERRQVIPCYAGISNAHISANGELWACAVLADAVSFGNLREVDFDFWRLWHSAKADDIRRGISKGECNCPLANQAYANMLLSPRAILNVGAAVLSAKLEAAASRIISSQSGKSRRRSRQR